MSPQTILFPSPCQKDSPSCRCPISPSGCGRVLAKISPPLLALKIFPFGGVPFFPSTRCGCFPSSRLTTIFAGILDTFLFDSALLPEKCSFRSPRSFCIPLLTPTEAGRGLRFQAPPLSASQKFCSAPLGIHFVGSQTAGSCCFA